MTLKYNVKDQILLKGTIKSININEDGEVLYTISLDDISRKLNTVRVKEDCIHTYWEAPVC